MFAPISKAKASLAAATAAVMLQAGAAEADLTNATFSAENRTLTKEETRAITIQSLKGVVADGRSQYQNSKLPFSDRARNALDELDKALDRNDDRAMNEALTKFGKAKSTVASTFSGIMLMEIFAPIVGITYFGFLNRNLLRREVQDRVIDRSTGFDFRDREFLEERLNSAKSTLAVVDRSFDILGYAWVRLKAKEVPLIATKYRLFTATGVACAFWVGVGLGLATGSGWGALGIAAAAAGGCAWCLGKVFQPLQTRGANMIEQYREWCKARD